MNDGRLACLTDPLRRGSSRGARPALGCCVWPRGAPSEEETLEELSCARDPTLEVEDRDETKDAERELRASSPMRRS